MKGIRLIHEEDKDQPWLVYVNPTVFGKRRRKRFKTKAEALNKRKWMIRNYRLLRRLLIMSRIKKRKKTPNTIPNAIRSIMSTSPVL